MQVSVIGAGLAGCEATWQLARRGIAVTLYEMKPAKRTPAHHSNDFAELCCSNSLRSDQLENAVGLLKEELRRLGSLILACADETRVEAGGALAVDRHGFARLVTERVRSHPNITVIESEVTSIPAEGTVIIASGPLTSDALSAAIAEKLGDGHTLNFYDAAAPLVTYESVDMSSAWFASRYDKGTADYINCPLTAEEYDAFWNALTTALRSWRGADTIRSALDPSSPADSRTPRPGTSRMPSCSSGATMPRAASTTSSASRRICVFRSRSASFP